MSIKTEIDRIKQSKADIISALTTKGVTVPKDASIDDLSALVEAISTNEDLSSELTTQNSLITTQETTIDNIISALQGKAGGGSGGSGGGISSESVNLDLTIISESAGHRPKIYYTTNEYEYNEAWYVEATSNSFSTTLNVIKHSYIFIVPSDPFGTDVWSEGASSGIEVISSGILAAQVNESGTLSVTCQGQ